MRNQAVMIILGALFVLAVGTLIFPIKKGDYSLYEALLQSSNPDTDDSLLSYSQQKREGVSKQIWCQDDTPLFFRIDSDESELFFFRQHGRVEVQELLGKVACIMQEELYFEGTKPMQQVRYMEAERASYNYNSHLFVAEGVKLWKYRLDGHTPPLKTLFFDATPLMQATAHTVEFSLKGEKLDFVAHRMKATLNSNERSL
jgi:hypothetical protein